MRLCFQSVEGMDRELARLARGSGRLRYALGTGLEALARVGGHHDLGFSSVEAYALERCERRTRWTQESRALARRLAPLPALRMALETGAIGLSMAQLLAKVARPEDEAAWLAEARTHTVREMQKLLEARRRCEAASGAGVEPRDGACPRDASYATEDSDLRTLTVTVDQEDAWLLECTRMIVSHVAGPTWRDTVEALLGEGTTSLLEALKTRPPGTPRAADFSLLEDEPADERQREWNAERARWRDEAEERCEPHFFAVNGAPTAIEGVSTAFDGVSTTFDGVSTAFDGVSTAFEGDATAIDADLRRVAGELAVRDLEIGRLAEAFWKSDGWRRLGYATETQYARERLGASLSWLKGKRVLARRVATLPRLDAAIRGGALGYEAACLVASVATPDTEEAWLERARERTVKHLREEVNGTQMLARLGATAASTATAPGGHAAARSALWPPSEEIMNELAALESHIVSGGVFTEPQGQISAGTEAAAQISAGTEAAVQISPGLEPAGSASRMSAGLSVRRGSEASTAAVASEPTCLDQLSTAVAEMLERLERGAEHGFTSWGSTGSSVATGRPCGSPLPSRKDRARGRVTLRLRVDAGTHRCYRWLERLFERHGPSASGQRTSFLRFLCASLVETWKHSLGASCAYAEVYVRDRYRCTSPVCTRRDVTPHHLKLRSAGGDDALENVTSLCVWCHLEGIHGARLGATPPASHVTWTLGQRGQEHTQVHGRRRVAVAVRRARAA